MTHALSGRFRRGLRGFTMMELIVVMAVIGLLLSIAVPRYFVALERGRGQVQLQNLALMREAIDKYYGDKGRYPDQLDDLVSGRYLRAIPLDPLTEAADWDTVVPPEGGQGQVYDVRSRHPWEPLPSGAGLLPSGQGDGDGR